MKKFLPSDKQREIKFSDNNAEERYMYLSAKKRLL